MAECCTRKDAVCIARHVSLSASIAILSLLIVTICRANPQSFSWCWNCLFASLICHQHHFAALFAEFVLCDEPSHLPEAFFSSFSVALSLSFSLFLCLTVSDASAGDKADSVLCVFVSKWKYYVILKWNGEEKKKLKWAKTNGHRVQVTCIIESRFCLLYDSTHSLCTPWFVSNVGMDTYRVIRMQWTRIQINGWRGAAPLALSPLSRPLDGHVFVCVCV